MVTSSYHLLGDHRGKVSKLQSGPNPAHGLLYICQLRTVFCNFKVLKKKKKEKSAREILCSLQSPKSGHLWNKIASLYARTQ